MFGAGWTRAEAACRVIMAVFAVYPERETPGARRVLQLRHTMGFLRHMIAVTAVAAHAGVAAAQNGADSAAVRAAQAQVRPGDRIALVVHRERELSGEIAVNERGEATFPKVGTLHVASLSIGELADTLRARYGVYLRSPEIEVNVLRRIVVNGEVRMPNVYLVDVATTLRGVIARAGGILETGSRGKVYVMRDGVRMHVKDWDREEGVATDLRSGDQVVVGRKSWLVLNALPAISTGVLLASFVYTIQRNR